MRSHAQKYVIKLCKKYNIEIKSKRKSCFLSGHLNFPYKRKNKKNVFPVEKMSKSDRKILKNFNFYIKIIDMEKIQEIDYNDKIFSIIKSDKKEENKKYIYLQNNLSPTTKQTDNNCFTFSNENLLINKQNDFNYSFINFLNNDFFEKNQIQNLNINENNVSIEFIKFIYENNKDTINILSNKDFVCENVIVFIKKLHEVYFNNCIY